jgi:hypothetical protein
MKNLNYFIVLMVLCISCSHNPDKRILIYQTSGNNNNEFAFYYNRKIHNWNLSNTINGVSQIENNSYIIQDTIEVYNDFSQEYSQDSVFVVAMMPGISGENGINFIANINDKFFSVDLYFPHSKRGSYTFSLSKDEKVLFNYLLKTLNLTKDDNLYLTKDTLHNSSAIYIKLFQNNKSKYVFASICESTKEIRILNNYLEILINEKINNPSLCNKKQKFENDHIEYEFDSIVQKYRYTGVPLYYDTLVPPMPASRIGGDLLMFMGIGLRLEQKVMVR